MPEIEIYHSGVIHEAVTLQQQGYLGERLVFAFAMGIHGGVRPTCKDLLHLVDSLPTNSLWSAIGIGQAQLPLNTYSILLGGMCAPDSRTTSITEKVSSPPAMPS